MIVCRYTGVFLEYTDNILNTLVQGINYCFYHTSEKQQKDANIYISNSKLFAAEFRKMHDVCLK